jgi:hypothetical protein
LLKSELFLKSVIAGVQEILGVEENYHPRSEENMHLATSGDRIETEAGVLSKRKKGILHFITTLSVKIQVKMLGFIMDKGIKLKYSGKNLSEVKKDNILSSDFRKYDGTLKMVVSSTPESRKRLETFLDRLYREKKIYYGIHISDRALLTCLLHYGSQSEVHFVDSADGGYAMAAKHLKAQMAGQSAEPFDSA